MVVDGAYPCHGASRYVHLIGSFCAAHLAIRSWCLRLIPSASAELRFATQTYPDIFRVHFSSIALPEESHSTILIVFYKNLASTAWAAVHYQAGAAQHDQTFRLDRHVGPKRACAALGHWRIWNDAPLFAYFLQAEDFSPLHVDLAHWAMRQLVGRTPDEQSERALYVNCVIARRKPPIAPHLGGDDTLLAYRAHVRQIHREATSN